MQNIYIPFCSLILNVFLIILYLNKVTTTKEENKYYLLMIIDTFMMTIMCLYAIYNLYNIHPKIVKSIMLSNKIECFFIINFFTNLFTYMISITNKNFKNVGLLYILLTILSIVALAILPVSLQVTNNLTYMVTIGPGITFTSVVSGVLLISTFYIAIKNKKMLKEKIIPIIFLLFFIVAVMYLRVAMPEVIFLEFLATLANLIMYHTIENPDVKMNEKLNIAKMEAERANELKRDFLSNMSHEIRTPLNAIVGLSRELKDDQILPDSLKEDVLDIYNSSNTLLEIVGNIIDINQIESQKINIIEVSYNPTEITNEIVKMNLFRLKNKPIKVNINSNNPTKTVVGSKPHIKQILNNLISNAMKYTNEGSIDINIIVTENNKLNVTVKDTGIGIKDDSLAKLFNKYERLNVEEKNTIEGTGLGLAITKQLVKLMDGTITVKSVYNQGTEFSFTIQEKEDNQSITESSENQEKIDYSGYKILIVDDNSLNKKIASRMFSKYNLDITTLSSGEECIDNLKNNSYDIILLDIMMPKLDGPETLKILKEDPNFNTPVIAFTADVFSGALEKYQGLGFNDYLTKPFNEVDTYNILKNNINRVDKS